MSIKLKKNVLKPILLACLLAWASSPVVFASSPGITASDIDNAKVISVMTSSKQGFVNIANGRNCLMVGEDDRPSLLPCQTPSATPKNETLTFSLIILENNLCLTDEGDDVPGFAKCDIQDEHLKWQVLTGSGTEIKNSATHKCLTANGIDKAVKLITCNGIPAQYWSLPK